MTIVPFVPAASFFDRDAAGYDAMRHGLIPCFNAFYGTAMEVVSDWRDNDRNRGWKNLRALDLGAGTGLLSSLLLKRHPDISLHLIDASEGMLQKAKRRLAFNSRISIEIADMTTVPLGGPWDMVVSALAIHHLEHDEKKSLFKRIYDSLRPGGLFVNAEQILAPSSAAEERYERFWLKQVRILGVPEDEIVKARERMQSDRCASMEDQLDWLREAGFHDADCMFRSWRFGVLCGLRPEE